jgi:hypothetical protein
MDRWSSAYADGVSDRHQLVALGRIAELSVSISESETRRSREVARAMFHGATWAQIGAAFGVTAQSAHRRFRYEVYDPATGTSWSAPPLPLA